MGATLGTSSSETDTENFPPVRRFSRMDIENLPPARASLVVEAVLLEKKEVDTNEPAADTNGQEQIDCVTNKAALSKEQLLKIQIKLPNVQDQTDGAAHTHLVLVVDKSGSMSGNPWIQVQASVKDIVGRSITQTSVKTDLILYADNAHVIEFTPANYEKVINDLKAGGMTNFKAAFTKVNRIVTEAGPHYSRTVVVFMTDGADTVNPKEIIPTMATKLAERWQEINKEVVIHTVGFTTSHDFKFLKNLSEKGGTAPGMFRYCEPGDDREALKHKLDELFNFILDYDGDKLDVVLTMEGDDGNCFLGVDKPSLSTTVQGKTTPASEAANFEELLVDAEAWMQLLDPYNLPDMSINVSTTLNLVEGRTQVTIPCIIEKTDFSIFDSADDKATWRLKILSRNMDLFVDRVGKAISENGDVSSFQEKIEKYQKQISHTRVFGNGITKERRQELFEMIQEIQKELDQVQKMLAEYARGGTQSIALLARAHDMRYQAVFSKSRRQRIMDKRASKNMQQASSAQESLSSLIVDEQEVNQLSQDATGFYFCMLSQNSIQDVLLGDDKEDAIGFGLAVKRNEIVLDEPTMIQIWVISGTLVSRTAMLDALEHKINVSSQLSAHGGFDFANTQLGVTTVGTSREPINAWLPLYITKSHWDRVKVILKPALGSFCTLDPLGYDYKQMDVMFMTLGSMIGQLRMENVGEHQLRLLFALLRTCAACLKDFEMTEKIAEVMNQFVSSPAGRTKDIIPNLFTMIGYIVALPTEESRKLLGLEGDAESKLRKLWLSLVTECLRRAAGSLYRETSTHIINGLMNTLLHGTTQELSPSNQGKAEPAVCRATAEIARLCLSSNNEVKVGAFDPAAGITVPEIELCHSQKVDRAMEIWAEKEAGYVKSVCKTKSKQMSDAKKAVQQWVKSGHEALGVEMAPVNKSSKSSGNVAQQAAANKDKAKATTSTAEDTDEISESEEEDTGDGAHDTRSAYEPHNVTASMLQILAKLHNKLSNTAYPSLQSIPGCIAFVNTWISRNRNMLDIDSNSGLAPDEWIDEIKVAITRIFTDIEEFNKSLITDETSAKTTGVQGCSSSENQDLENPEVLVVPDQQIAENQVQNAVENVVKEDDRDLIYSSGDDDDSFDEYLDDDSDDEMAFEARRQMKKKKAAKKQVRVTVPEILHSIDSDLDITLLLRGMVCQAVRFHSNSAARAAITAGQLKDLGDGSTSAASTLSNCHQTLQDLKESVIKGLLDQALWKRANHCMVHASTVWAFIGYLMNTHKDRGEGFNSLLDLFATSAQTGTVPYLDKKVHVLLTGKYKDCVVFANGNQWLPEKKMATVFKNMLGEEKWMEFEVELRSAVQIHVYRESDIPNRHGHCNSNPYIPNALRLKLGMDLLPEPKGKSKGKRGYLKNSKTS